VPEKYFLSKKACEGILRRAKARGKELPEVLRRALEEQAGVINCDYINVEDNISPTIRAETHGNLPCVMHCKYLQEEPIPIHDKATRYKGGGDTRKNDGAGNGFGVGKPGDPMPTMTSGDRHSVCYAFDSLSSNSMKSSNPHSGCRVTEVAKCIDTTYPCPSKNQGGMAVLCPTMIGKAAAFKQGNSATAGGIGYAEELAPTLTSGQSGTNLVPAVVCPMMIGDVAATLRAGAGAPKHASDENGRLFIHPICQAMGFGLTTEFGQYDEKRLPMLRASGGDTGEGGEALVVHPQITGTLCASDAGMSRPTRMASETDLIVAYAVQGNMIGRADKNGPQGSGINKDVCFTLNATDQHGVCAAVDCRNLCENHKVSGTLQSKATGGYSLNYQNPVRCGYRVRRLTPTECERLQGLPDGWTKVVFKKISKKAADKLLFNGQDIEIVDDEYWAYGSDSARYKALGNGMAQPCVDFIFRRIKEII